MSAARRSARRYSAGSSNTIARHFANFINAIFDGVWASAAGNILTITSHSLSSVWQYHVYTELPASNTGTGQATVTGDLPGGTYGVKWVIDPTQTPVLNRAFATGIRTFSVC